MKKTNKSVFSLFKTLSITAECILAGMFGSTKFSGQRRDFYDEVLLGNVSPSLLNKELEKRKLAAEKPDLTGIDRFL